MNDHETGGAGPSAHGELPPPPPAAPSVDPMPGEHDTPDASSSPPTRPLSTIGDTWQAAPPGQGAGDGRRTGWIVGSIAVVMALIVGVLAFSLLGSRDEAGAALALRFVEGETTSYAMHMTMKGSVSSPSLPAASQPLDMNMKQDVSWTVRSVDEDGVATVEFAVTDMSGSLNGMEVPASQLQMPPVTLEIAPDGRILTAGGLSFESLGQNVGTGFPGMGQYTPVLPDGKVEPGDTWKKDFSQDLPFGEGKIEYTTMNTFQGYEQVGGRRVAVVTTSVDMPLDFSVDLGDLLEGLGDLGGAQGSGGIDLSGASISYGGNGSFFMTSYLDVEDQTMVKSASRGDFDMTMEFKGIPAIAGEMSFQGAFTQTLRLIG